VRGAPHMPPGSGSGGSIILRRLSMSPADRPGRSSASPPPFRQGDGGEQPARSMPGPRSARAYRQQPTGGSGMRRQPSRPCQSVTPPRSYGLLLLWTNGTQHTYGIRRGARKQHCSSSPTPYRVVSSLFVQVSECLSVWEAARETLTESSILF
jgi:hypothetical protein